MNFFPTQNVCRSYDSHVFVYLDKSFRRSIKQSKLIWISPLQKKPIIMACGNLYTKYDNLNIYSEIWKKNMLRCFCNKWPVRVYCNFDFSRVHRVTPRRISLVYESCLLLTTRYTFYLYGDESISARNEKPYRLYGPHKVCETLIYSERNPVRAAESNILFC